MYNLLKSKDLVTLNTLEKRENFIKSVEKVTFNEVVYNSYQGKLELLINDIIEKKEKGYKTVILAGTRPRGRD